MGEKLRELAETSSFQLSLVLALVSAAFWISEVASEARVAHGMAEECAKDFKVIDERLSRIEGVIGSK